MFAEKFEKSERFLPVLREHNVFNVKWVEVYKTNFFWPWDFLLGNLKLRKTLMMFTRTSRQTYKCFIREITIFKKMILNMRFRISFILIKISIFWGFLEGDLTSALSDSHVVDIFTAPPPSFSTSHPSPQPLPEKGFLRFC